MESRGEKVRAIVREYGFSITGLAKRINISRTQLYIDFENPEMSFDRILAIGKAIRHDFSQEFKELQGGGLVDKDKEHTNMQSHALAECQTRLMDVQSQLIRALNQLDRYKQQYGPIQPA